jgi:hypothetical protein
MPNHTSQTLKPQTFLWITRYNDDMDIATLYIYWVYGMIGLSGLAIIWGTVEFFRD